MEVGDASEASNMLDIIIMPAVKNIVPNFCNVRIDESKYGIRPNEALVRKSILIRFIGSKAVKGLIATVTPTVLKNNIPIIHSLGSTN